MLNNNLMINITYSLLCFVTHHAQPRLTSSVAAQGHCPCPPNQIRTQWVRYLAVVAVPFSTNLTSSSLLLASFTSHH